MVVDSFACPACAEQIAPGRLSCPQCGTVLAAVARSWRSAPPQRENPPVIARPPAPSWLDAAAAPAVRAQAAAEPWSGRSDEGWDDDGPLTASIDTGPAHVPTPVAAMLDAPPDRWRPPRLEAPDAPDMIDRDPVHDGQVEVADGVPLEHGTSLDAAVDAPATSVHDAPAESHPAESLVAPGSDAPAGDGPQPGPVELGHEAEAAVPRSLLRPTTRANPFLDADPPAPFGPAERPLHEPAQPPAWTPAAYVPPSTTAVTDAATLAAGLPTVPADPPARILPRAWDPQGAAAERATAATPASADASGLRRRFALPEIDRARIDDAAGVVVLAGAMGSLVGFLLPWSRVVIGSRGAGTYFDTWGLAGQGHLIVFLLVLGALALGAIPNRIDTWLRTGIVGIALGALLLGLAWPYAFGPLGAGVGIVLLVVAACLLLLGGLVSTLVQRHGGQARAV